MVLIWKALHDEVWTVLCQLAIELLKLNGRFLPCFQLKTCLFSLFCMTLWAHRWQHDWQIYFAEHRWNSHPCQAPVCQYNLQFFQHIFSHFNCALIFQEKINICNVCDKNYLMASMLFHSVLQPMLRFFSRIHLHDCIFRCVWHLWNKQTNKQILHSNTWATYPSVYCPHRHSIDVATVACGLY